MPDQLPQPTPFAVNPEEAIRFLRDKLRMPTATWTDLWQEMHARAFVVAGAQSDALLADFHDAVTRALSEGRTLAQFRDDFDRIVAAHGWSYKGSRGWRSAVIFNTNLRMAYATGQWKRIERVKAQRPYLRYVAVMDNRTRPLHRAWHNTVLPVDHPWWDENFPPNGWNCRCSIHQLSERDLKRLGLEVSETPPPDPPVPKQVSSAAGQATIMVPEGIDPGFAYNPGRAAFGGAERLKLETHGAWQPLSSPIPTPALEPLVARPVNVTLPDPPVRIAPGDETGLRAALRSALGSDEVQLTDPVGAVIALGQAIVDHILEKASRQDGRERFFLLIPSMITDPDEIWIGWAQGPDGRVVLRRRYIRLVRIDSNKVIGMVCDADGRIWSGLTFFRGSATAAKGLRTGLRVYRVGD